MYSKVRLLVPPSLRRSMKHLKGEILHHSGYLVRRYEAHPAATHTPILIGLNTLFTVERVLELGCGIYSTLLFTNRSAFPNVTRLDSLEDDPGWFEKVRSLVENDSRVNLRQITGSYEAILSDLDLTQYDLIFVDNYSYNKQRIETIRTITRLHRIQNTVIFHDYEQRPYRNASKGFENHYRFRALNPNTGVAWDHSTFDDSHLKKIEHTIQRHSEIQPENIDSWVQIFAEQIKKPQA